MGETEDERLNRLLGECAEEVVEQHRRAEHLAYQLSESERLVEAARKWRAEIRESRWGGQGEPPYTPGEQAILESLHEFDKRGSAPRYPWHPTEDDYRA